MVSLMSFFFFFVFEKWDADIVQLVRTLRISRLWRNGREITILSMERRNGSPMASGLISARLLSGQEGRVRVESVCW